MRQISSTSSNVEDCLWCDKSPIEKSNRCLVEKDNYFLQQGQEVKLTALQTFSPHYSSLAEEETNLLARLDHENIVKVFHSGFEGNCYKARVEFFNQTSLSCFVKKGNVLSKTGIALMLHDIGNALIYLEERGNSGIELTMDSIAFGRDEKGRPIFKLWKINSNIRNESENIPLFQMKMLAAILFTAATGKELNWSEENAKNMVKQEWNNSKNDEWENKLKLFVLRLLSEEQNMKAADIMQFSKELLLTSFIKPVKNCKNIPRRFSDSDVHKAADENMKIFNKEIFCIKKKLEEDLEATRVTLMNEVKMNEELTEMFNSSRKKYENEIEKLNEQLLGNETMREKMEREDLKIYHEIDLQLKKAQQEIVDLKRKVEFKKEMLSSRQNEVNEEPVGNGQWIKNSDEGNTLQNARKLRSFAIHYMENQNWKESFNYFYQSLLIFSLLYDEDHDDVAFILNSIGVVCYKQDKLGEAKDYFKESMQMYQRLLKGDHDKIAQCLHMMAIVNRKQKNWSESIDNFKRCLEMRRRLHSGDNSHDDIVRTLNDIGVVYDEQNKQNNQQLHKSDQSGEYETISMEGNQTDDDDQIEFTNVQNT